MAEIHIDGFKPSNRESNYDLYIFQSADDEIVIGVANTGYHEKNYILFPVPVREKWGYAWKCEKSSVACDSGKAADILDLFAEFPAYARATAQRIIFDNPRKAGTPGL